MHSLPGELQRANLTLKDNDAVHEAPITRNQYGKTVYDRNMYQTVRCTRVPRTQTAKISYKPASKNHIATDRVHSLPKTEKREINDDFQHNDEEINNLKCELNMQKNERNKGMLNIHEMFDDFSNSPIGQSVRTKIDDASSFSPTFHGNNKDLPPSSSEIQVGTTIAIKETTSEPPVYNRSQSDMCYGYKSTALTNRNSARSTALSTSRELSLSCQALVTSGNHNYNDRADARRFMEEQRKKRRVQITLGLKAQKTALEKEEIKKRLEKLRLNTRKIIIKNIQKRKNNVKELITHSDQSRNDHLSSKMIFKQPSSRSLYVTEFSEITNDPSQNEQNIKQPICESKIEAKKNRKGLMQKPESSAHSYIDINNTSFNKDNEDFELLTTKFADTLEQHEKITLKRDRKSIIYDSILNNDEGTDLNASLVDLKSRTQQNIKSSSARFLKSGVVNSDQSKRVQQIKSKLPYWLKPSAVHVYPYNFICAVRRKLESIATPPSQIPAVLVEAQTYKHKTSTGDLLEKKSEDNEKGTDKFLNEIQTVKKSSSWSSTTLNQDDATETEFSKSGHLTNYSSISIDLPELNTESELSFFSDGIKLCEIKKEKKRKSPTLVNGTHSFNDSQKKEPIDTFVDDDTTISSAVLNSVEIDSPLLEKNIQDIVPRISSPLNIEKVHKLHILRSNEFKTNQTMRSYEKVTHEKNESTPYIDFDKFLIDFNRSLSQVIQVNEKLQNTIKPKPSKYSSESTIKNTQSCGAIISSNEEYATDDFEPSSCSTDKDKSTNKNKKSDLNKDYDLLHHQKKDSLKQKVKSLMAQIENHVNDKRDEFLLPIDSDKKLNCDDGKIEKITCTPTIIKMEDQFEILPSTATPSLDMELESTFDYNNSEFGCSLSGISFNYSNADQYDTLIQKELRKPEQLTVLLKIREKAILDRTRGQIAWLELQKERYKTKGLLSQTASVKKKQRAILLKMEKEREEIKRLLHLKVSDSSLHKQTLDRDITHLIPLNAPAELNKTSSTTRIIASSTTPRLEQDNQNIHNQGILHANYELQTSRSVEDLLTRREVDLRRRHEHVVRLIEWHKRLDQEETDVKQLENRLMKYKNKQIQHKNHEKKSELASTTVKQLDIPQLINKTSTNSLRKPINNKSNQSDRNYSQINRYLSNRPTKMEEQLIEIGQSLHESSSISGVQNQSAIGCIESVGNNLINVDFVRTNGCKLNKLWRRLTLQHVERFDPHRRYKLCRADIERIYEEAKLAVLNNFSVNEELLARDLLDSTVSSINSVEATCDNVPPMNFQCSSSSQPDEWAGAQNNIAENYNNSQEEETQSNYNSCSSTQVSNLKAHSEVYMNILKKTITKKQRVEQKLVEKHTMPNSVSVTEIPASTPSSINTIISGSIKTEAQSLNSEHTASKEMKDNEQVQSKLSLEEHSATLLNLSDESLITEPFTDSIDIIEANEDLENGQVEINIPLEKLSAASFNRTYNKLFTEQLTGSIGTNVTPRNDSEDRSSNQRYSIQSADNGNNTTISNTADVTEKINNLKSHISISAQYEKNKEAEKEESVIAESILKIDLKSNEDHSHSPIEEKTTKSELEQCSSSFEESFVECKIDDISEPQFEMTFDATWGEIGKRLDVKTTSTNIASIPKLPPPPSIPLSASTSVFHESPTSATGSSQLMPDIINELEIRRCQQIFLENEHLDQYENMAAVPYVYVREIPNKPPPPYVPPDHGSPMTTIFPSEERIKDITFRNSHELYCELLNTEYIDKSGKKLSSVHDEKITNIYERIILDICREYLEEHREVLQQGDPENFHSQLAFFNPPDRLRCLQESIYREVRLCLAMNKSSAKRSHIYSVYGPRAKGDHIGTIITQELYEEDNNWCNFRYEEEEVLELIIEEILAKYLSKIATDELLDESCKVSEGARNNTIPS